MKAGRVLAAACILLGGALPARAQDAEAADVAPAAPPAEAATVDLPEQPPPGVESIEVTGERLDATDIQDEAQAITVFDAQELDRANIFGIDKLAASVPGLHVGQSGQAPIVTLRGIGTENASITGESGVAFHVDGVYYARPAAARLAFFDLETLDVKRGPQGLSGGKNSTSGSINVVTRKPSDEYELRGDLLLGNYDRVQGRGAVNVPFGELGAARFAMFYEDRDGVLDNKLVSDSRDPFDVDNFGLRGHLKLVPAESLEVLLSYNYFKEGGNGPQADLVPRFNPNRNCGSQFDRAGIPPATVLPNVAACHRVIVSNTGPPLFRPIFAPAPPIEDGDPRDIYLDASDAQSNRYWGWTTTLNWDVPELPLLGETRLKGIGGFQRTDLIFDWDFDATSAELFGLETSSDSDQYSAELQWSGNALDRLDWQAGTYFSRETGARAAELKNLSTIATENRQDTAQTTENKSYGVFLNGELSLSETVRFGLGGRWIKDRKQTVLFNQQQGGTNLTTPLTGCRGTILHGTRSDGTFVPIEGEEIPSCSRTFRAVTWGAKLDWRPFGEDHLLYAGIDRGFKSGGFRAGTLGEYEPERIWAYKLGSKSEFFDQRLQLNIEGFFSAYQDMQLALIDGTTTRTENSDARMYGVELEGKAMPIEGLQLTALISLLKTETLDYFSLDPAAFDDQFQTERLNRREEAEKQRATDPLNAVPYELQPCINPANPAQLVPCGTLGDRAGEDDFSGKTLSRSPRWKLSFSGEYEIPLGRWGSLIPRAQYTWTDETYYRVFNRDFDRQEPFHQTDAKLIWRSPEERWEVEAFVENIEDEAPKQNILVGARAFGSPPLAWYGPPRFYGVRAGFSY